MKKIKKPLIAVLSTTVAAVSLFAFTACNTQLTDEPLKATKIADYTKTAEDRAETFASGSKGFSWENGDPFNVWWKPKNVSYEGGKMSLSLSEMTQKEQVWDAEKGENVDCAADYYGAEERSEHYYGYGDFQVRMKPAKIVGTASTFFTCTGPYDKWYNEDGTEVIKTNKHDEIDIEFLGKDTTKVQFNYFANGKGGHEYMYNLGFDASVEFHDYGYRWTENYITWFVDSEPVYRVDRKGNEAWPENPGRIIMNYWCGTKKAAAWMGTFKDDYSGKAEYEYVATSATQCPDPNTAHIKEEPPVESDIPTEGWTDISTDGFDGWGNYAVDKTNGLTISHSKAFADYAYKCGGMDLTDSYSWVKFKIKNNEDAEADARIDVKIKDTDGTGAVAAVYSESENASLVAAESAALIHLDANEELEVALKMKNAYVNQVVLFFNSIKADNPATGSITITELQGIVNEDVEKPDLPQPPTPVGATTVKIDANEVEFKGAGYTVSVSEDQTAMTVEYSGITGNGYNNISTDISSFVGDNNVYTVTVKNEGTETAKVRIDINCAKEDGFGGTNDFCNIKAEYTGNVEKSGNDYTYGGADWVEIAAGETVTVKITFTENVATGVKFFIDSSTWVDEAAGEVAPIHSGKIIFSGMSLSKATAEVGGEENAD